MERITVNLDAIWNYSELDLVMKEFLIKKMREKGLKLTPQRLGVIDVLVKKIFFIRSARVIYDRAKRGNKGVKFIDGLLHPQ
jgi:Fe2+ or Zn2+ uptake regulation protein